MKIGVNTNKVRLAEAGRGLFQIETISPYVLRYVRRQFIVDIVYLVRVHNGYWSIILKVDWTVGKDLHTCDMQANKELNRTKITKIQEM